MSSRVATSTRRYGRSAKATPNGVSISLKTCKTLATNHKNDTPLLIIGSCLLLLNVFIVGFVCFIFFSFPDSSPPLGSRRVLSLSIHPGAKWMGQTNIKIRGTKKQKLKGNFLTKEKKLPYCYETKIRFFLSLFGVLLFV